MRIGNDFIKPETGIKNTLFSIEYRLNTDFNPLQTTMSAYLSPLNPGFRPPKRDGRDLIHQKYGFSSHRCSKGIFSLAIPKFNFIQLTLRKSNCGNVKKNFDQIQF